MALFRGYVWGISSVRAQSAASMCRAWVGCARQHCGNTYKLAAGAQLRIAQSRPSHRSGGGTSDARNDLFPGVTT
jgi:hypothetical protein